MLRTLLCSLVLILTTSCGQKKKEIEGIASKATLYYGGDIITMEDSSTPTYVESLVVENGKILFAGKLEDAKKTYTNAENNNLNGNTLIPGFIDSHSHIWQTAQKLGTVSLDPQPAGDISSIDDIISKLSTERKNNLEDYDEENEWLIGWGFDNAMLAENRFPNSKDLDKVSTETPIALVHFSGHIIVMNTKGMERAGYLNADYKNPEGGSIRYYEGTKTPNGIIEEQAGLQGMSVIGEDITGVKGTYAGVQFPPEKMMELVLKAQDEYIENGYTTITDFASTKDTYDVITKLGEQGKIAVDVGLAYYAMLSSPKEIKEMVTKDYKNHVRVIGGKINLDGGSPGRTAFLRDPYYTPSPGQSPGYRGYSSIAKQADMNALVSGYYKEQVPLFIHALGDAALDQCIEAIKYAEGLNGYKDIRTNLIHLQLIQADQFEKLKELDVTATFQITHNYYFADFHNEFIYGPERTQRLNPMKEALEVGLPLTFHHDSPIHPIGQLHLIWTAVNRTSRSGKLYGGENRLTVYEALYASTATGAYQYFEEDTKGTIEVGKLADLVILDKNPLKVDPADLKNIKVVETIKEGKSVYKAN